MTSSLFLISSLLMLIFVQTSLCAEGTIQGASNGYGEETNHALSLQKENTPGDAPGAPSRNGATAQKQIETSQAASVIELKPNIPYASKLPDLSFLGKWRITFSSQGGSIQVEARFFDANGEPCGTESWQAPASPSNQETSHDITVPNESFRGELIFSCTQESKLTNLQTFQLSKGEITFTPVYNPRAPKDTSTEPYPVLDVLPPPFPTQLKPGQKVDLPIELPPFETSRRVAIATQIWRDGKLIDENWYQPDAKPGENTLELIVPLKIAPGNVTLRLQPINASFTQNISSDAIILDDGKQQGTPYPKAEIVTCNGISVIQVNGELIGATQALLDPQPYPIRNCANAGIRIWSIWLDDFGFLENGYDYTHTDAILDSILRQDPRGYLIINIITNGRYHSWWMDKHPEAWVRTTNYSPDVGDSEGLKVMPSNSSPIWRKEFGEATRKLVEHLKTTPYAERIIGFQPCNGETSEWFNWGSASKRFIDYSECGKAAFRQWLAQKYQTDQALQIAWNHPAVTLATAEIPSIERRSNSKAFYDIKTQHDVVDYHDFQHWHTAETIIYYARIIKQACQNQLLVGTYYGYAQHLSEAHFFAQSSGHFDCRQFLDCPDLDFTMAPIAYCNREVGNMAGTMLIPNTWNLNHKLAWNQFDIRTHWVGLDNNELGSAKTIQDDFDCQDRELARNLKEGNSTQLYDFVNGWTVGDKRLMTHIKKINELGNKYRLITRDFPETDYLLVVIDEKTTGIWNVLRPLYGGFLINYQRSHLDVSGIPWKAVYFSDLQKHPELLKYKAMYFINLFRMDEARYQFLKEKILCDNRLVIFTGQTGIYTEKGLSSNYLEKMTGQPFDIMDTPAQLVAQATDLWPRIQGEKWGRFVDEWTSDPTTSQYLAPVNPPSSTILATATTRTAPAALYIQKPEVNILWSQAPALTPQILWEIARRHHLPVVATGKDPIYIGHGFIGIHSASNGEKQLTFFEKGTPVDILTGEKLQLKNQRASFKMRKGETRIFVMQ